jgi:hypothetical protein
MWLLIGVGAVVLIGGSIAAGAFLFGGDSDDGEPVTPGTTTEVQTTDVEVTGTTGTTGDTDTATAAKCEGRLRDLLGVLEDLDSRLIGVGVDLDEYSRRVGDVNSAYDRVSVRSLGRECVNQVGIHTERATNTYNTAGEVWNHCYNDPSCKNSSLKPVLDRRWDEANASIRRANQGLRNLARR